MSWLYGMKPSIFHSCNNDSVNRDTSFYFEKEKVLQIYVVTYSTDHETVV